MAVWTDIPVSATDADSPITDALMTALAENPTALAEGAAGAPKIATSALDDLAVTQQKIANLTINDAKIVDGTMGHEKFQTDQGMADWVAQRLSVMTPNAPGQLVFARGGSAATYTFGSTATEAALNYSASDGASGAPVSAGTYVCLGAATAGAATLWMKIS